MKAKKPEKKGATPKPRMGSRLSRSSRFVIDFHAHMIVPEAVEFARDHLATTGVLEDDRLTKKELREARKRAEAVGRRMRDYKLRIKDMDNMRVDIQVLAASLVHQCTYWADPETSLKMEQLTNNRIAEAVAGNPNRFVGLGGVPLQSPSLAAQELERCIKELGLKGVQISSQAADMELGDERLRPFWAKAAELGAVIYVHPAGITEARFQKNMLWNSLGQPMEEALAMASLFYEGVLDAFPKLKLCIAHGGGFLPFYTGRVDRNYLERPATRLNMSKSPSQYLKVFRYDTCLYNRDMLGYLAQKVGAGCLVMGSDYPVGESDPVGFVRRCRSISSGDKEKILWKNAARLLGLSL